jgi:hypothetical protein
MLAAPQVLHNATTNGVFVARVRTNQIFYLLDMTNNSVVLPTIADLATTGRRVDLVFNVRQHLRVIVRILIAACAVDVVVSQSHVLAQDGC